MADVMQIGTAVVSVVTALGVGVNWLKGRSEARKLDRDGFVQLADSGVKIAVARAEEVEQARAEVRELRTEVRGLLVRERQRDAQALEHQRWDYIMLDKLERQGIVVPPPPPLFLADPTSSG